MIELLVVVFLLIILFGIVLIMVNPVEAVKRGRDSTRLADFKNIEQAISSAITYGQQQGISQSQILCGSSAPCPNSSTDPGARNTDGTGWVKVNLKSYSNVHYGALPVDPLNSPTDHYYYTSNGNDWEIMTKMESNQYSSLNSPVTGFYTVGTTINTGNYVNYSNLPITITCTVSPSSGTTSTMVTVQVNGSASSGCVGATLSGDPPIPQGSTGCGSTVTKIQSFNYPAAGLKHAYVNVFYNGQPAGGFECSGSPVTIN